MADKSHDMQCVAVYAHGGGYARGEARMYIRYMERWVRVAAEAGIHLTFVSVEYPLSDKNPHPAQLDAFISAYRHLLNEGISSENIVFMGDSAGGGLCVLSGFECMSLGLPQPAGSILLSLWIDMSLRCHQGGNALVETDYVVTANKVCPIYAAQFLGGLPGDSKQINPLYREPSEITGLNPLLILTGAAEFAVQDSKDLAMLASKAGVENKLICEQGQLHIYALGSTWLDPRIRERTDKTIVDWMKRCID
ncbi:hypothetical protein LTR06_011232 [Exophiala xenobiotica]|nr:hypothetical protein LTR06_011232 [Exophiala xenobiotica]